MCSSESVTLRKERQNGETPEIPDPGWLWPYQRQRMTVNRMTKCHHDAEQGDHKRPGLWRAAPLCLHTCANHLPWSPSVSQSHHVCVVLRTCVTAEISLAPRVLAISRFIVKG